MTKGPNDLGKGSKMVAVTHEEKLASAVNTGSIDNKCPSIMITSIFISTIKAIKDHLIVDEKCVLSNCQWEQDEFTPCSSCKGQNGKKCKKCKKTVRKRLNFKGWLFYEG